MIAAGKKNRLKMKYPMKLWPFRPATRAGQNAIAIQMTANKIHQRTDMAGSFPRSCERSYRLPDGSACNDVAGPGCCAHHPGITLGGVICGGGDDDASPVGRGADVASPRVPATALIRAGAAPGDHLAPGIVRHGRQAPLPWQGPGDGAARGLAPVRTVRQRRAARSSAHPRANAYAERFLLTARIEVIARNADLR